MKVYGIVNCNTVKKATDWLKSNDLDFEFHDYKKKGIDKEQLKKWTGKLGWETLINKKGTTWRTLPDERKVQVRNEETAIELMMEKPSVIKRPLIEFQRKVLLGFDENEYQNNLKK